MSNLKVKLIAVMFACGFWMYIVSNGERIYKYPEMIPVQAFNVPENLIVLNEHELGFVTVDLRMDSEVKKELTAETIKAYIDTTGLAALKEHELEVKVLIENPKIQLIKVSPNKIKIKLDNLETKIAPVELNVRGLENSTKQVEEAVLGIESAQIKGAASQLNKVIKLLAVLEIKDGDSGKIERAINLLPVDNNGIIVDSVVVVPSKVDVSARVAGGSNSKTIGIKLNLEGNPEAGYFLEEILYEPSKININGEEKLLETLDYLETEAILIDGITTNIEQEINLKLPEGIELKEGENATIKVNIKVTSQESTRELFAGINLVDLPTEYKITKVTPSAVMVKLKGAFGAMKNLKEEDVYFNLDLSEIENQVSKKYILTRDMIVVPHTLQIDEFEDREVEVFIEKVD